MDGQARADGGEQCGQAGASRRAGRLAQAGAGTRQQACAARRRQTGAARQAGAGRDPQAGEQATGLAGLIRRASRAAHALLLAPSLCVVGSGKLREPPSRSRLHESFTNLRQGGGRPGLRSQLRRLSARARARARADSSRNAMFSAAQVRQTARFARFSAGRRCKTSRFAMFSGSHIHQTSRFAMLSAARLVKHARFAGFPAVAGCALGAPGGPRRPACRLPLQGWPGLRGQLRGLSARARAQIRRETRCFLQRRFAKRRVLRGFLRGAVAKHCVSRCFLPRT